MDAQYAVVDKSSYRQEVEHPTAVSPSVGVAVLGLALVCMQHV